MAPRSLGYVAAAVRLLQYCALAAAGHTKKRTLYHVALYIRTSLLDVIWDLSPDDRLWNVARERELMGKVPVSDMYVGGVTKTDLSADSVVWTYHTGPSSPHHY